MIIKAMIRRALMLHIGVALISCGCSASLSINVSVYKGPIVDTIDGRLDKALGLAAASNDVARRAAVRYKHHYGDLLSDISKYYENCSLPKPGMVLGCNQDERTRIRSALISFSDYCQSVAQRIGFAELKKVWFANGDLMAVLVDIDENGRIIDHVVNSILRQEKEEAERKKKKDNGNGRPIYLSRINNIMASQAPGSLITAIKNYPFLPFWRKNYIESIYHDRYWDRINPVRVKATGNFGVMLVKDETGNWHIKKVTNDPTKVIEALRITSETALNALITANGMMPSG